MKLVLRNALQCSSYFTGKQAMKRVCKVHDLRPREVSVLLGIALNEVQNGRPVASARFLAELTDIASLKLLYYALELLTIEGYIEHLVGTGQPNDSKLYGLTGKGSMVISDFAKYYK